jgi:FKBP-type peptidyl-prolyl cis-trans isomerase FkpA
VRNFVLPFFLIPLILIGTGCIKDDTCSPKSPTNEAAQIQAYASANGINATAHSSGLYYEIIDTGSGATATVNSGIVITYTGKLLNGNIFDQQTTPNSPAWELSKLIEGWRLGIPLIQKGGHIKLIIPSSLAYGCTGYGSIPGDAILFFDIELVDVQ